ncbi:PETs, partial [Symbiodinium sp. CCMP2456]
LEKLTPGDELGGEVRGIAPFGIFVSVGAESDGLVHVKRINQGLVADLSQVFQRGDRLVVRVFDIHDGKLELELVDVPPRLPRVDSFEPLQGETVDAEVFRKIPKAFIVSVTPPAGGEAVLAKLASGPWTDLAEGEVTKVKIERVD